MRSITKSRLSTALLFVLSLTTSALQVQVSPEYQPFTSALTQDLYALPTSGLNETSAHEQLKRQNSNSCPQDYDSCANLGAPGLCCNNRAVCSADFAGHVACCPTGAACSGTVAGVITAGTLSNGNLVGGGAAQTTGTPSTTTGFEAATTTSSGNGLVLASTDTTTYNTNSNGQTTGFVYNGESTVATPGAAVRKAELPGLALAVIRLLQFLPL